MVNVSTVIDSTGLQLSRSDLRFLRIVLSFESNEFYVSSSTNADYVFYVFYWRTCRVPKSSREVFNTVDVRMCSSLVLYYDYGDHGYIPK